MFADPGYKGIERRKNKDRRKGIPRRNYERFQIKEPAFVKLNAESDLDVGQLLDISKGGLSLCYFITDENTNSYSHLGIFMSNGDFVLDQIPFRIISDLELANNSQFSTAILRRYGIQFERQTPDQTDQLDNFIELSSLRSQLE